MPYLASSVWKRAGGSDDTQKHHEKIKYSPRYLRKLVVQHEKRNAKVAWCKTAIIDPNSESFSISKNFFLKLSYSKLFQ
jgi:hypothetical protein